MTQYPARTRLPLMRIVEMNAGFLGLQFSFGLQQANMGPIYGFLGANEATMPLLWLAGPVTGLVIQPIVGALSDRTRSRIGQRTPYFLFGAVLCSLCLFAMPGSRSLLMAASLLWLLDAGNNISMEPYRAYVADRLEPGQRATGFLIQSAFTGLAQTLSYLAPSLLALIVSRDRLDANGIPVVVRIAFVAGAILSVATMAWSVWRVPEGPSAADSAPHSAGGRARIRPLPGLRETLAEIASALAGMPPTMRKLAVAMLCQWYAMFAYWQYVTFAVARSLYGTGDPASAAFRAATLATQQAGALYNLIACVAALGLIPVVRWLGARLVHALCLGASGAAMLAIAQATGGPAGHAVLWLAMLGIGLGWAGMMGNTYVMLADEIPAGRNGIYMGLFNLFIVVPMLIETVTVPLLYQPLLGGDPRHVLVLAGAMMLAGALATLRVRGDAAPWHRAPRAHPG